MGHSSRRTCLVAVVFVALFIPVSARAQSPQAAGLACSTFDASNEASSSFDPGEQIIVRGTGFGAGSLVFVRFEQGARSAELGRVEANDLGAFAAPASQLPEDADEGLASIIALDARGSATCAITMGAAVADEEGGLSLLYIVWGGFLAIFAIILAVLTYRRWKNERLKEAMARIKPQTRKATVQRRTPTAPSSKATSWELDVWEVDDVPQPRTRPPAARVAPQPEPADPWGEHELEDDVEDDPGDDVVDHVPEYVVEREPVTPSRAAHARRAPRRPERPVEPEPEEEEDVEEPADQVTFPIGPQPDENAADDLADVDDPPRRDPPRREPPRRDPQPPRRQDPDTTAEPQRLPEGWDGGRLRPSRTPSDAIERLQREVRTWGRT